MTRFLSVSVVTCFLDEVLPVYWLMFGEAHAPNQAMGIPYFYIANNLLPLFANCNCSSYIHLFSIASLSFPHRCISLLSFPHLHIHDLWIGSFLNIFAETRHLKYHTNSSSSFCTAIIYLPPLLDSRFRVTGLSLLYPESALENSYLLILTPSKTPIISLLCAFSIAARSAELSWYPVRAIRVQLVAQLCSTRNTFYRSPTNIFNTQTLSFYTYHSRMQHQYPHAC